jgi:hypothetical protein
MHEDTEREILNGLADLKKEVSSLKKKLGSLTKQVNEQIAISGFQEQLTAFDRKITELESKSLDTQRTLASDEVEQLRILLDHRLITDKPPKMKTARDFLLIKSTEAKEKIKHSSLPFSISDQFNIDCRSYFKDNKFRGFRE